MNAADRLTKFIEGIEAYVAGKNITPTRFSAEFAIAETLTFEQLQKLTHDECYNYAYHLYQYADHIAKERANCETVIHWCTSNLDSILSFEMEQYTEVIAKHEMKVARILRNNELAHKIHEWKLTAECRLEHLKSREYNVRKKADILMEKGRRK